jgi:kynurenine formamidase
MQMCNHAGTHIDFPSHVIKDGKTSSDVELGYLIGTGLIVHVPDHFSSISK